MVGKTISNNIVNINILLYKKDNEFMEIFNLELIGKSGLYLFIIYNGLEMPYPSGFWV